MFWKNRLQPSSHLPWRWRRMFLHNTGIHLTNHTVITQKAKILIFSAMKTLNLKFIQCIKYYGMMVQMLRKDSSMQS
jgi:hypothetical protein